MYVFSCFTKRGLQMVHHVARDTEFEIETASLSLRIEFQYDT